MSKKTHAALYAKLDALYAELPRVECRGLCFGACGPIPLAAGEAERMRRAHPERLRLKTVPPGQTCGYLNARNRCSVYAVRPMICRAWGALKNLSCMHGCTPDRWISTTDLVRIAAAIERLAGDLVVSTPDGIEPLGDTYRDFEAMIAAGQTYPPELVEAMAERTHAMRALHGGRVVAVGPTEDGGPGGFVPLDTLRRKDPIE